MFLEPLGLKQGDLAAHLDISYTRLNELINGHRAMTVETAVLLAQAFRTTPEFWLDLQTRYDLATYVPNRDIDVEPLVLERQ